MTFLPIHAAGNYDTKDGDSLLDYAVSSYTITLNGLLSPLSKNQPPLKMLVVIEPNTPGTINLPSTIVELQNIKSHVSKDYLIELGTADSPNSMDKVLFHLPDISMVHFACHGTQNLDNPLESALLLSDGPMKVSQIMQKSLVNASLAFLSACETAVGDKTVPDESIHIASAMLFAGFRGVVGTMWYVASRRIVISSKTQLYSTFLAIGLLLITTPPLSRTSTINAFSRLDPGHIPTPMTLLRPYILQL